MIGFFLCKIGFHKFNLDESLHRTARICQRTTKHQQEYLAVRGYYWGYRERWVNVKSKT